MSLSPRETGPDAADRVREPVTLRTLERMRREGHPFACLACSDATTARWLERAGVHVLLMGDSAAETVLGFDRTIHMPLDVSVALTAAIKRGAPSTLVMADMPFMSYHTTAAAAVRNAGRYMTEGLADVVKLEADASLAPLVRRLTDAGIPVCAHIGCRPQHAARHGGYGSAGRTPDEADAILRDAAALEAAGAVLLLVEAVPPEVGDAVAARSSVPVIGIGAGTGVHGQILVVNDLLGLTDHPPRFAEPADQLGVRIRDAGAAWVARVREGRIGGTAYRMKSGQTWTGGA